MAEVIGLAASLITLAGTSAQLARTLLQVANVIKSAEYEARLIAADISVFSNSLTQLSTVVDLPHPKTEKLREITVFLIAACSTLIEDMKMLIGEPIQKDPRRRAFTMPLIRFRFRWMKIGPKVMFVKSLVDSFKTTILVLVSTMNLAVALQRDAPESISDSLRTQVESHIQFAEDASGYLHHHSDTQQDECPSFTLTLDSSALTEVEVTAEEAGGELVMLCAAHLQQALITRHNSTVLKSQDCEDDSCAIQISRECAQVIELQEMSCALAKDVLDYQSPKATWSWNASGNTSAHRRADYTAYEHDSSTSNTRAHLRNSPERTGGRSARNDMPQERQDATPESPTQERRQSDITAENSRVRPNMSATSSRRSSHEDHRLRKLEKLILAQKDEQMKKDAAAASAAEAIRIRDEKEYERFQVIQKAQQETEAKAAIELALKTSAPMMFQDPIGRKFSCPWHLCHTWEGMQEFIAKIGSGVAIISELVRNGEYDLLKDIDLVIPPHLWESMVFPGSLVTMRARNLASPPIDKKASWLRRSIGKGSG